MQYRRAIVPGGTFFFTLVADRRRPILASSEAVDVLRNAFRSVRQSRPFEIDAIVVMPDHVKSGYAALTRPTGLSLAFNATLTFMKKAAFSLAFVALINGCATTSVTQFQAPDGTSVKTVKCSSDATKCFSAASQSCSGKGTYKVVSSASRSGGLAADILPGPVTWYYMTYICGLSDGAMPEFKFTGQQYVPPPAPIIIRQSPTTTTCTGFGNSVTCNTR